MIFHTIYFHTYNLSCMILFLLTYTDAMFLGPRLVLVNTMFGAISISSNRFSYILMNIRILIQGNWLLDLIFPSKNAAVLKGLRFTNECYTQKLLAQKKRIKYRHTGVYDCLASIKNYYWILKTYGHWTYVCIRLFRFHSKLFYNTKDIRTHRVSQKNAIFLILNISRMIRSNCLFF